jgi:hypothetical protein
MNAHDNPRFLPNRKVAWRLLGALALLFGSVSAVIVTNGDARTPDQGVEPSFISTGAFTRDVVVQGPYIYWIWRTPETWKAGDAIQTRGIGRAKLDGSEVNKNFIPLPDSTAIDGGVPGGIASDGIHLYWTISSDDPTSPLGFVSKATLDGTTVIRRLVSTGLGPVGISVSGGKLYWTNEPNPADPTDGGTIGTATTEGGGLKQDFITNASRPYDVEVAGGYVYYSNFGNGKSIGRANLNGSDQDPGYIVTTLSDPVVAQGVTGLTSDGTFLYWSNYIQNANSTVGRFRLGTDPVIRANIENTYLQGLPANPVKAPVGLAVTPNYLYWTSFEPQTIGRTEFDKAAPVLTVAPVNAVATGPTSNITYPVAVTATDVNDDAANITITCDKGTATGGSFPVGVTKVTCVARDAVGNTSDPKAFDVTLTQPTAPALQVPENQAAVAADPSGAKVVYPAATSPAGTPTCTPASDSLFPVGVTTVECSVTDGFAQTTKATFTVTVGLPGGPQVKVPADRVVTATSSSGAAVTFEATSAIGPATCSPASGSTFPLGTTKVTCTVTDAFNQVGTASFNVVVNPPAKPTITVPANVEVLTEAGSAKANFGAATSAAGTPTCSAASGATFPAGVTTVTCKVTDAYGQVGTASFTVTVKSPVFIPVVQVTPDTTTTVAPTTVAPTTAAPTTAPAATAAPTTAAPLAEPAPVVTVPAVEVAGVQVTPEEAPAATPIVTDDVAFAG